MTKQVRIENADGNTHDKVRVTAQVQQADGTWIDVSSSNLAHPTARGTFVIWSQTRLIVEEYNDPTPQA